MFAALSALRKSLGSFGSWKGVEVKSSGIFCASFLIIALVYGCGGGDGGGSAMTPPPEPPAVMPKAALEPSVQAAQAPLFDFGDNLHIGTSVAPPLEELDMAGARNGVEISKGSVRDGAGAADVIAYLRPSRDSFRGHRTRDVLSSAGRPRRRGNEREIHRLCGARRSDYQRRLASR